MSDEQKRWLGYAVMVIAVLVAGYLGVKYPLPEPPWSEAISITRFRSVSVEHDLSVDGTANLDDVDFDLSGEFEIDGALVDIGGGTGGTADGDNDLLVAGDLEVDSILDIDGYIKSAVNLEHIALPTVASASVITTSTDGALFTIGDGEIWFVHAVLVNVTTNFDCTGNDCTLIIGDGSDTDGLVVLADAELQTTDTEGTGWPAGWQGLVPATQGVYIDAAAGSTYFVYAPSGAAETIDVDVGGTDVAAGAATVYIIYTRVQ